MEYADKIAEVLGCIDELQLQLSDLRKTIYREIQSDELGDAGVMLLTCRVGDETIGLPLARVHTVVPFCRLTPIPEAPVWLSGLLDYHGHTMPVLDVLVRMTRRAREPQLSDRIVICRYGEQHLGLLVQAVDNINRGESIAVDEAVHDLPHAEYLAGVALAEGELAIVLSVPRLLATLDLPGEAQE